MIKIGIIIRYKSAIVGLLRLKGLLELLMMSGLLSLLGLLGF